jgi:hypothetical protein
MEKPDPTPEEIELRITRDYLTRAVGAIGECLTDLGTVIAQGPREDNVARRGSIAVGLERAASYVRGKPYQIELDEKHAQGSGKTGS